MSSTDSASRASAEILDTPSLVKVVIADDGRAMYFSRAPIPYLRDRADAGKLAERTLQHIGVYAYSREALREWVALPPHPLEEIERRVIHATLSHTAGDKRLAAQLLGIATRTIYRKLAADEVDA